MRVLLEVVTTVDYIFPDVTRKNAKNVTFYIKILVFYFLNLQIFGRWKITTLLYYFSEGNVGISAAPFDTCITAIQISIKSE